MKYPKSFIDFVEKNGSWYYDSGFFVIDKAPEQDEVITAEATFLDLEGYMGQWAKTQGYYLMIDLCNECKDIIKFYADLYWMAEDGILDDENDDKRLETKGMFNTYEEAFMAAFEKVCELVK